MRSILLDRKNACHVGCSHRLWGEVFIFEPSPKQIQIGFLRYGIILCFPNHGIPLIYDEDKRLPALFFHAAEHKVIQRVSRFGHKVILDQILPECGFNHTRNFPQGSSGCFCSRSETGDIQADHIVFVQVPLVVLRFRNLLVIKQRVRITGTIIVSCQHSCIPCFPKSAGSADARKLILLPNGLIHQVDQWRLVDVVYIINLGETRIARIDISSHFSASFQRSPFGISISHPCCPE